MSGNDLQRLLAIQDLDIKINQLLHRLETLPERAELASRQATRQAIDAKTAESQDQRLELQRSLKRNEDELAGLEERIQREDSRLYSGEVSGTRELLALQEEIYGWKDRRSGLETDALELMEMMESLDAALAGLDAERASADAEVAAVEKSLAEAEALVRAEMDEVGVARSAEAETVPPEALSSYESLRHSLDGVGVARFRNGACEGCHLALSAMEVDRIRHASADEICHCEECGRILVQA